jgi:penicillin amidase
MRRWIRRIALVVLVVVLVALVAGAGFAVITVRSSFPQTTGEVTVPGLGAPVEVRRDGWGIPHITADTAEDLFLAQGYVHAQDRFWEMDFRRHVTAGRLSELFGADQLGTDTFIRTLGWRRIAEQELEILDPATIGYLEAYAAGVNAYLADHSGSALSLEYAVLGFQNPDYAPEPWTPADSVAWLKAMAWNLGGGMNDEVQRVVWSLYLSDEQMAEVHPPYPFDRAPVIVTDLADATATRTRAEVATTPPVDARAVVDRLTDVAAISQEVRSMLGGGGAGNGIGSNSFVIGGERTESGMPILGNDPHLAPSLPGIWTQIGLHCRTVGDACPFDVSGFSFSGFPGVILGHNDRIAWGFTNLDPDVQDLVLEDVQGDQVRIGSRMEDLDIRTETIQVAGGDPVTIRIRSTQHGPLISDPPDDWYRWIGGVAPVPGDGAPEQASPDVALQWTALRPGRSADSVFMLNRARDFDDFREAAASFEVPSQNMIYADVDGHIGYQTPGTIPIRRTGDGKWPVPGWDPDYGWDGFVPFEDLPWMLDPEAGYIVTANNAVVDGDYPVFLTDDWTLGDRAGRLVELVEAAGPMTVESTAALAFDQHGPLADVLVPALRAMPIADGSTVAAAMDLVAGWDGQQTADSAPAAFVNAVWSHLVAATFNDQLIHPDFTADGGDRWLELMRWLLESPNDAWWDDIATGDVVEDRDAILQASLDAAVAELSERLGEDPSAWTWGALHTFELRNETFGESGIAPIEWLFNRGTWELGGGRDVVDATGWDARFGYEVDWVPSMRMVIDLSDLDASRYVNLTGASGHAFHEHYDDQTPLWAVGENTAWPFSPEAVEAATEDLLTLNPE